MNSSKIKAIISYDLDKNGKPIDVMCDLVYPKPTPEVKSQNTCLCGKPKNVSQDVCETCHGEWMQLKRDRWANHVHSELSRKPSAKPTPPAEVYVVICDKKIVGVFNQPQAAQATHLKNIQNARQQQCYGDLDYHIEIHTVQGQPSPGKSLRQLETEMQSATNAFRNASKKSADLDW